MRKLIVATLLLASTSGFAASQVQVFENGAGVKLVLVTLPNPKHFAAEISGTRTELDRSPLLLEIDTTNSRQHIYKIANAKKDKFVLLQAPGSYMQVIVPDQKEHANLVANAKLAAKVNADAVINDLYFRAGAGKKNAKSDNDGVVTEASKKAGSACGASLQGKIDWASFAKPMTEKYLVGDMCAAAMYGLNEVCSDSEGKGAIKKSVTTVTCRYGNAGSFQLKGKEVVVLLKEDTPDQSRNLKEYLENTL